MTDQLAEELLSFAQELADESGKILMEAVRHAPEVTIKQDSSYVTQTDKAIEARLRERIEERYPDHGILGEEHGSRDLDAPLVWVLDPIDGTAPFIAGIPVYGTLIAVAREGRPWLGLIDHPASQDRWWGRSDGESLHNGNQVKCRACADLSGALMTNSNPDFFNEADRAAFDRLRSLVHYVQYGGSCYSYGVLASGRTDLAIDGGFDPFDAYATAAVIAGAGGCLTDWQGAELSFGWDGKLIAAGDMERHREALEIIQSPA